MKRINQKKNIDAKRKRKSKKYILKLMKDSVKQANLESNLVSRIYELTSYIPSSRNNQSFKISCISSSDCSKELFDWMMKLLKGNMSELYNSCEWGWNEEDKKIEMCHKDSRFLVVRRETNNEPVAFSHFRFDMDDGVNVLYCYELQLDQSVHKIGLGKHLMIILEKLCSSFGMKKVVLTVFNNNKNAFDFFCSQGYKLDETSPQNFSIDAFYSILSKNNKAYSLV